MFDLEFYETASGKSPVADFITDLPPKMQAKVFREFDLLEEFGNQLRMPHSREMGDDLYELRIKFSSDTVRVFYFFFIRGKIILTNGFIKKSEETPTEEKQRALRYKRDYERRHPR